MYGYGNGLLTHYDYVADSDGQILIHIKSDLVASWLLYGFSNEKTTAVAGPVITSGLSPSTPVAIGTSRDLVEKFTDAATPTVQWFKGTTSLGAGTLTDLGNSQYSAFCNTGVLESADDGSVFKCTISDSQGSVNTQTTVNAYQRKMVAYYNFDSAAGGIFADSSGEGHDAAIDTTVTLTTGKFGQAATFDGYRAYAGTWNPSPASEMTISFWLKHTASINSVVISKGDGTTMAWRVIASSDNRVFFDNGNWQPQTNANVLKTDGTWQHVCVVESGNTHSIYVDGVFQVSATAIYGTNSDQQIVLGDMSGGWWNAKSPVDDLKIFNYAFDAAQVRQMMANGYICRLKPAMDLNGDCKVNIRDLAEFAKSWSNCNRYPASECNN
jgi:hypothetical protein